MRSKDYVPDVCVFQHQVETIGDAYMVVSGAPEKEGNHAERVCDMALDMVDAITDLKDPSTGKDNSNLLFKITRQIFTFLLATPHFLISNRNLLLCKETCGFFRNIDPYAEF